MKARAFKNIGLLAIAFASFASPVLAQEVCDHCHRHRDNSSTELVDLVSTDPYALARLLRNTAGLGHDTIVSITNQAAPVGLASAAAATQILAQNQEQVLIDQEIATAILHNSSFVGVTASQITNLLNLARQYEVNTFLSAQNGDTAGTTANYNAWVAVGQQIAAGISSVNRHVNQARLQNLINQYIVAEIQQYEAYQAATAITPQSGAAAQNAYFIALQVTQNAVEIARLLGVYLSEANGRDSHHHVAFDFDNVNYVDTNYVPHFGLNN